jgi:hypothetical protein
MKTQIIRDMGIIFFSSRAQKELQTKLKIWNGHSGENDKEKQKKNH